MDGFVVICFSKDKGYLKQLLEETKDYYGQPIVQHGYSDETKLLGFVKKCRKKQQILLIALDLQNLGNEAVPFLLKTNELALNSIKLVISDSEHLLQIQEQITSLDSIHFLGRSANSTEFKIALNTTKNCYQNLQIITNNKSEVSSYSKKLDEELASQLTILNDSKLATENLYSIIAHDLKSPFTALLGISDILISDWDDLTDIEKLDLVKGLKTTSENTYKLLENFIASWKPKNS